MHMLFQSTSIGVNLCTYSTLGMYKSTEAQKLFLLRSASLVITAEKEKYKVINKQTDSVAQKSHQPLVFNISLFARNLHHTLKSTASMPGHSRYSRA